MRLVPVVLSLMLATTASAGTLECAYAGANTVIDIDIRLEESNGTIEVDNRFLDLECEIATSGAIECKAYCSTSVYSVSVDSRRNEASITRVINGFAGPIHDFLGVARYR